MSTVGSWIGRLRKEDLRSHGTEKTDRDEEGKPGGNDTWDLG